MNLQHALGRRAQLPYECGYICKPGAPGLVAVRQLVVCEDGVHVGAARLLHVLPSVHARVHCTKLAKTWHTLRMWQTTEVQLAW